MPDSTAKTTHPTAEIPEVANQVREQLLSSVKQTQKLGIDAASAWAKAAAALPASEFPSGIDLPGVPSLKSATAFVFDLTIDVLNAQRQFALDLVDALTPATSA